MKCGLTDGLNRREVLAVRLAEAVSETPGEVSEDFFQELRAEFNPQEIVELTSAYCWKNYLARFNRVFDVPEDDYPE